jgi:hypothetical protein
MREVLGERVSVLVDLAVVHLGAVVAGVFRIAATRSAEARAKIWERVAVQARKAGEACTAAELAALERGREAALEAAGTPRRGTR